MKDITLNLNDIIRNTISNGYKFKTHFGTIGIVVNYDDTTKTYLYRDDFNNYHYGKGTYIIQNKIL